MSDDFNADDFINATQTDAVETKFTPVPEGDDYVGSIVPGSITVGKVQFRDGTEGARFRCQWQLQGEIAGMTNPKVRQDFLLDVDGWQANGAPSLRTGANANIRLGRLIELSGQSAGQWSFKGLEGATAKVGVKHRPDKDDPEVVYAEVSKVTKL